MTPEFYALQQVVAGRFSLVRELGRGGMGIVFLARDVALDRLVAIKLLPPALASDPVARGRFVQEARMAAGLSHPHIVPIHLVEEHETLVFFVMSFIEGETLGDRVRRRGPLGAAEAIRVTQEVAWALGHAHGRGVIHRDVKPDNILLDAESGRALVTDFGIARSLATATPAEGSGAGTPQYLSPEVAQGGGGDARSDLYSLGVTAWVAAVGRPPITAASATALILAQIQVEAPSLATAAPHLPTRFTLAIDRCLLKDPAARWPSAEALAAEIAAASGEQPRVPAPIRRFGREWESVGAEVATAGTAAVIAALEATVMAVSPGLRGDFDASILAFVFALMGVLTGGLALARATQLLSHARALLRERIPFTALAAASRIDALASLDAEGSTPPPSRSTLGLILAGAIAGTGGGLALAFSSLGAWSNMIGAAMAVILPTVAGRTLARMLDTRGPERLSLRVLRGPIGRALFKLGGIGLPATEPRLLAEGPTVLALGDAARELLAALPPTVGVQLAGVGPLIDSLEQEAMRLRTHLTDPEVAARFASVAGALEALRIDLLRLRMSQLPESELTQQVERLRELGASIDARLAAEQSVAQLLRAPEVRLSGVDRRTDSADQQEE